MLAPVEVLFRCPGEAYDISRAVHLGRLAAGYDACRDCPQRHETTGLPPRIVQQLVDANRTSAAPLWYDEGLAGRCGDAITPAVVKRAAAAFGGWLYGQTSQSVVPVVALAGNEQPNTAELVAAAIDGVRYSGCRVLDMGHATSSSLTFAMHRSSAAGGLLVGNPLGHAMAAGLKFWHKSAQPLSARAPIVGPALEEIRRVFEGPTTRPTRRYGSWQRARVEAEYIDGLQPYFHALRPLDFVVSTNCLPLRRQLATLLDNVGCQARFASVGVRSAKARPFAERKTISVRQATNGHFALWVDGDGECCLLSDEQGHEVTWDRTLTLLAEELLWQQPGCVVAHDSISSAAAKRITEAGGQLVFAPASRGAMDFAMRSSQAILGGDCSGRLWFADEQGPAADALHAIALVLTALSRSDRPLSQCLAG